MEGDVPAPDLDRLVQRLLDHMVKLQPPGSRKKIEAQYGEHANQVDLRNARGFVVQIESKWSIVAIAIAALALGVMLNHSSNSQLRLMETMIELGHQKAQAARELATEKRLNTEAVDELRLEMQQTLKTAGIKAPNTHDHGK